MSVAQFGLTPQTSFLSSLPKMGFERHGGGSDALARRYEALSCLSLSLASSSPDELSQSLATLLHSVLDFDFLDLIIFKEAISEALWRSTGAGKFPAFGTAMDDTTHWPVYQQQSLCSADWKRDQRFAIRGGAPKKLSVTKGDPEWPADGKNICALPLVSRHLVLGILALGKCDEVCYTQEEMDFLTQVSSLVALAIENTLVNGELRKLKDNSGEEKVRIEDEIRSEPNFDEIVGRSAALQRVLREVEVVAPTDSGVLIQGETGTGKELIAHAIHNMSARRDRPFIKLSCAAIPSGLLESELFGHEKGAFTGAIMRKPGRFEIADKGTLFLDEVGDIPLELQSKLLRVLQEQEFERLGSTRTQKVDVRVIAATHRDLKQMVEDGQFRSDLFYRLHVFPLLVPPLRERREDIPLLARHYVEKYATRMNRRIESIPSQAMDVFTSYSWPGNVRELQNFIERAVILSPGSALRPPLAELQEASVSSPSPKLNTLEEVEREHVLRAIRESNWVIGGPHGAAARLGMKRTTLTYRIRKLKIQCRPQ
jgi:formate hydrogenlyase transcriptional activator